MHASIRNAGPDGLEITIHDTLTEDDYQLFRTLVEERINRFGSVNLLVMIRDFSGWTPAALWEEIRFDVTHYGHVGRLAIVGAVPINHWMASLTKPFTSAEVRYYCVEELDRAREWVRDLPLEQIARRA